MTRLQFLISQKLQEGKTYRRIGLECDINHVSISQYHKGEVEPDAKNLQKMSRYFGVEFYDLLSTVDSFDSRRTRTIPVITKVQAGDFGYWEDAYPTGQGIDRVECPTDITDSNAFALKVEGDSMYPRYMHGEIVIVDTTKPVMNNDDVVCKLDDGAAMLKRYKMISGMVFLESYNPAVEPIPVLDGDMVWCYKVVCRR